MRILYAHTGIEGKSGWGRVFYMARGLADLGHDVTLLTINPKTSFFKIKTITYKGVKIKVFPDFFPSKFKTSGFAIWSTFLKILYAFFSKFDICIAACGHRPAALPCKINRIIHHSLYYSEWWDFYGKGGYNERHSRFFKLLYSKIECYNEIADKRKANAVIVLSSFMKKRAIECGIDEKKIFIVPGGSIIDDIKPLFPKLTKNKQDKIKISYIGVTNTEIDLLTPFINALKDNELKTKFRLILYGSPISAKKWDELGLSEIADFRGWLDYEKNISSLNDIDIFLQLLPDNNISKAGWPNKLGDYLAIGKPIIISPYGDITKFIEGQKGFFKVEYNKESIFKTLQQITLTSTKQLYDMGISNYELAKSISWKNRAKIIEQITEKIQN